MCIALLSLILTSHHASSFMLLPSSTRRHSLVYSSPSFPESNPSLSPIFKNLAESSPSAAAILKSFSSSSSSTVLPDDYTDDGKPSADSIPLKEFLSFLQSSLLDVGDDSNFIDAGRELMAITRFQAISDCDCEDQLALCCWTEIDKLQAQGKDDSGCLLVFPGLKKASPNLDLSSWTETNLREPLELLHLSSQWSIKTYDTQDEAGRVPFPAIRLLHRLTDAPTDDAPVGAEMTAEEAKDLERKVDEMYDRAERQVRERKKAERKKKEKKEKKKALLKNRPGGGGFGIKKITVDPES